MGQREIGHSVKLNLGGSLRVFLEPMNTGIEEFTPAFFDAASAAWRRNKIRVGEGSFRYKKNAFPDTEKPLKKAVVVSPRRSPRLAAKQRRHARESKSARLP